MIAGGEGRRQRRRRRTPGGRRTRLAAWWYLETAVAKGKGKRRTVGGGLGDSNMCSTIRYDSSLSEIMDTIVE
jgi:hypothetical protein